jgi:hypothetical protein
MESDRPVCQTKRSPFRTMKIKLPIGDYMCDRPRGTMMTTNQHDVEMMKVLVGAMTPLLQALTAPITHNHYHHQSTQSNVSSNPYRNAKTVCELEQIVLSEPKCKERETILKHLSKFPETMPVDRIPMPNQDQKRKLLR